MDTRHTSIGVAGWGATIALIIGFLNLVAPEQQAAPAREASPAASADNAPNVKGAPVAITGRQLLERFLGDSSGDSIPAAERYRLGVLFVTVPDPVDSHLDWAYDAQLNAVRRALERDNYVIDLFWMPWGVQPGASGSSRAEEALRATHPGVMLFRRSKPNDRQLRLVYVVGEIPTSGVHKAALLTAFTEARWLLDSSRKFLRDTVMGRELRIVGPVFSGAAVSLRQALDQWRSRDATRSVRIITGSASNTQNKTILEKDGTHTTFFATVHDDGTLWRFQTEVLANRMRISPRETAILRETSTQYGQLSGARPTPLDSASVVIPFPMHISELRAEYARNPDQLILGPPMPGDRRGVRLPMQLGEKPRVADGPPVLSELTPPAVDAMIDDIARTLNAHHVRAVGILATDARDVIFLGTEIRKRVRDVLLFTYGSNTLYARPDVSEWLRGMLVVSTYPVTVESQFWDISQTDRQRVSFSGDMAEGMYNAVLMQLGDTAAAAVVDYAHPLSRDTVARPPIWITTVGRSSMLPVRPLHEFAGSEACSSCPVISPNPRYVAERHLTRVSPDIARTLIRGQEGRGAPVDIVVFALLIGLGFAWLLRDQLGTTYEERREQLDGITRDAEQDPNGGSPGERERRSKTTGLWMSPTAVVHRANRQLKPFEDAVRAGRWDNEWAPLNRLAQVASLMSQREMYIFLRAAALTLSAIGGLFLLFRARAHTSAASTFMYGSVGLATAFGVYVVTCCGWRWMTIQARTKHVRAAYLSSTLWPNRVSRWMWQAEIFGRYAVAAIGLGAVVTCWLLVVDVARLDPVASRSFFYRSTAITAGVTPAIPLLVSGVLFYAWSVWNAKRVSLLLKTTAFEQLYLDYPLSVTELPMLTDDDVRRIEDGSASRMRSPVLGVPAIQPAKTAGAADAARESRGTIDALVTAGAAIADAGTVPDTSTPNPPAAPREVARVVTDSRAIRERVRQVRVRLFLSVPGAEGIAIFGGLVCLAVWAWTQFNPTIEAVLLPAFFGLTTFDLLLRTSILAAIGATIFGVYRLVGTWLALRGALRVLADTPLVYAFERLPATVSRLTRLSPIDQPSDALINATLARKWNDLRDIEGGEVAGALQACMADVPASLDRADADTPPLRSANFLDGAIGRRVARLYCQLENAWARWSDIDPAAGSQWENGRTADTGADRKPASGSAGAEPPRQPNPKEIWLRTASQCGAIYVIEYVEWVLHHLRNLAGFLMLSIILVTILLGSYSFQPESALKAIFFAVSVMTVSGLVFVLLQMNRNDILSFITRTDPGRLSWDGAFTFNLALYVAVPLLTLLSSEIPEVREFLFSWVSPLLRALGKG